MRWFSFIGALLLLSAPAQGEARPACAGRVEVAAPGFSRVDRSGAIILRDGRAIRLEGIRLPRGAQDHAPQTYSDQALAVLGGFSPYPLTLTAIAPMLDRYGRIRGQVFAADKWLQQELLKRGLARVAISPDRFECASLLYAAEAESRRAGRGLWADRVYAVRTPLQLWSDADTFQIVEGQVVSASMRNGRAYLNFGSDWRRDFTVTVDPIDMVNFRRTGVDPLSYVGQTVRVRGLVQLRHGPEIEAANPQGIEVVN